MFPAIWLIYSIIQMKSALFNCPLRRKSEIFTYRLLDVKQIHIKIASQREATACIGIVIHRLNAQLFGSAPESH